MSCSWHKASLSGIHLKQAISPFSLTAGADLVQEMLSRAQHLGDPFPRYCRGQPQLGVIWALQISTTRRNRGCVLLKAMQRPCKAKGTDPNSTYTHKNPRAHQHSPFPAEDSQFSQTRKEYSPPVAAFMTVPKEESIIY